MVPSSSPSGAAFRTLTHAECVALLARNHLGRVAFRVADGVDVRPIHYAYEPGWLYGRTAEGTKLDALDRDRRVAFEVDEVRGALDWASVVVRGSFHRLSDGADDEQRAAAARAVHLLRAVIPATFAPDDPVGFRSVLFRISVGTVTGRAAAPPGPNQSGARVPGGGQVTS